MLLPFIIRNCKNEILDFSLFKNLYFPLRIIILGQTLRTCTWGYLNQVGINFIFFRVIFYNLDFLLSSHKIKGFFCVIFDIGCRIYSSESNYLP